MTLSVIPISEAGFGAEDNIEKDELVALKKLAAELLAYDDKTLARVLASGVLAEVNCDEKTVP